MNRVVRLFGYSPPFLLNLFLNSFFASPRYFFSNMRSNQTLLRSLFLRDRHRGRPKKLVNWKFGEKNPKKKVKLKDKLNKLNCSEIEIDFWGFSAVFAFQLTFIFQSFLSLFSSSSIKILFFWGLLLGKKMKRWSGDFFCKKIFPDFFQDFFSFFLSF